MSEAAITDSGTALVNISKVCTMLMLDEDSVKGLFRKFADMLPDMVAEIKNAANSGDLELVRRLGHKLKGTVGNFRVVEMQSICDRINKLDNCGEEADFLLAQLEECTKKLIAEINKTC